MPTEEPTSPVHFVVDRQQVSTSSDRWITGLEGLLSPVMCPEIHEPTPIVGLERSLATWGCFNEREDVLRFRPRHETDRVDMEVTRPASFVGSCES